MIVSHYHHHQHQEKVHKLRIWWINYWHWNYSSPPLPNLREASHPLFSSDLFSGFLPHSSSDLSHISLYPPQVCQSLVPQPLSRIFSATPVLPMTCRGQDWTKKCVLCYHKSAGEKLSQHKTNKNILRDCSTRKYSNGLIFWQDLSLSSQAQALL